MESEKRYIEALDMIKTNFKVPLSTVLREDEKKSIFYGIEVFYKWCINCQEVKQMSNFYLQGIV